MTMNIEKAFDSLDHAFIINILIKFCLVIFTVISVWNQFLQNNQEACVINNGNITQHFCLEQETWQGDPTVTAYLVVLSLETVLFNIKVNPRN